VSSRIKQAWLAMAFPPFFVGTYFARFQPQPFPACPFPTLHCLTAPPQQAGAVRLTCPSASQADRPAKQHLSSDRVFSTGH